MEKDVEKNILIFSDHHDQSTNDVIDWLLKYKASFVRLNGEINIDIEKILIDDLATHIVFASGGKTISTDQIKSFWYRRGFIGKTESSINISSEIAAFLKEEEHGVKSFLSFELDEKSRINRISSSKVNKLYQLKFATICGLNVPKTMVTSKRDFAKSFMKMNGQLIAKSVQSTFFAVTKNKEYGLLTSSFDLDDFEKAENTFFLTKFQKQIEKQYELRIFYLNRKFYSMAIFSQKNSKTSVDFRNYDSKVPNRTVPFNLPLDIKKKLKRLMSYLQLDSGSIDMIVDNNEEYHFLEVNPVGQFGMVSYPCNYNLEEEIAKILIK